MFTPALSTDRFAAGRRAGADISLVDLEDSIAVAHKARARAAGAGFFVDRHEDSPRLAVRINTLCDPEGLADLLALRNYPVKPDIVLIPKVESARDIEIVEQVLGPVMPDVSLFAVVETPAALERVSEIARSSPMLKALIFGSADYSMSVNSDMGWDAMYHARAQIVAASRAAGKHAIDTPYFDIPDLAGLEEVTLRARNMGFSGKAAIHPSQVPVINRIFAPAREDLSTARRIVEASSSSQGICVVDGIMVGRPILEAARRTLEEFDNAA